MVEFNCLGLPVIEEQAYQDPYEISNKQWQKIITYLDGAVDNALENGMPKTAISYARMLEQVALASTGDLTTWNEDLVK